MWSSEHDFVGESMMSSQMSYFGAGANCEDITIVNSEDIMIVNSEDTMIVNSEDIMIVNSESGGPTNKSQDRGEYA